MPIAPSDVEILMHRHEREMTKGRSWPAFDISYRSSVLHSAGSRAARFSSFRNAFLRARSSSSRSPFFAFFRLRRSRSICFARWSSPFDRPGFAILSSCKWVRAAR
jgi:hypothetical protein